jgi:hypothetical protein
MKLRCTMTDRCVVDESAIESCEQGQVGPRQDYLKAQSAPIGGGQRPRELELPRSVNHLAGRLGSDIATFVQNAIDGRDPDASHLGDLREPRSPSSSWSVAG